MRINTKFLVVAILVTLTLFIWFNWEGNQKLQNRGSTGGASGRTGRAPVDESPIGRMLRAFDQKVVLYGRVVDQHGSPIEGAEVKVMPQEKPFADGTRVLMQMTDADGRFTVTGLRAFAVGIDTFKSGYFKISDVYSDQAASSRLIEYGLDSGKGKLYTEPSTPAVFTLYKPRDPETLLSVKKTRTRIPRDGQIRSINLLPGDSSGTHVIEIKTWSDFDTVPEDQMKFSWKMEINVPGGGLILRNGPYDFEAPTAGYQQKIMFDFPASKVGNDWKGALQKSYFVKFGDGVHALWKFDMAAYADNSMIWNSWLNPKASSTNLSILPNERGLLPE